MTKTLVTGATGFLGTSLVQRLVARGRTDLRCLVRQGSDVSHLEGVIEKHPDVERFVGSLASVDAAAAAVEGVDTIFHVAAAMGGAPADIFLNTVVTTKNLCEAIARTAPSRGNKPPLFVLVSSFGVYGVADLPRGTVVDEGTPLENKPARRDPYSQGKLRQEKLCWEYHDKGIIRLAVARPGVIYGPRGGAFSARVGLNLFGVFLHLGGRNTLPLTYVDNCAEAIALLGDRPEAAGQVYNVVDDDLVDADDYLRRYKQRVTPLRSVSLPYPVTMLMSHAVERYHRASKGQLPAVFTPYKTKTTWKGNRFSNEKLKAIGWRPIVTTEQGLERTFEHLKARAS
ncbi:MAG: epimerase [Myxococcales bacterium 68-20]|nr:NAD(P)-dependent oxidoreductase [Myxococcales bacterium]OJY15875.1 MAG: epimerase [Myxococcales bacterium 68-20]